MKHQVEEKLRMRHAGRTTIVISTVLIVILAILLSNALGQRPFRPGVSRQDAQLEKPPVAKDNNEQKIFGILENILENQRYRNVPPQDGRFFADNGRSDEREKGR